jgi:hypothetical protein
MFYFICSPIDSSGIFDRAEEITKNKDIEKFSKFPMFDDSFIYVGF